MHQLILNRDTLNGSGGVSVRLFGRPEVSSVPAGKFPAKGLLLLALVLCAPGRKMTRIEAANLLWDGKRDGDALTNLRQLLSRMRRLEPETGELLLASPCGIAAGADVRVIDLYWFPTGPATESVSDLSAQIMLYRGELLVGVEEPTSAFSEWLLAERAALRNRFFRMVDSALFELTRYGRASGETLAILKERVLALEPERESSYRTFIEAFGRNGMFDEARQTYAALQAMSRRVYRTEPSAETQAVVRRVLSAADELSDFSGVNMQEPAPQGARKPRIALLNIVDPAGLSDPALIAALIEDIANELARYRTFTVLAPHSSQAVVHYSGKLGDNSVLRADFTVSGFIKPGREPVLAIRMTDCSEDSIVWAAEYSAVSHELIHTFHILSAQISSSLAAELEREMLGAKRIGESGEAYSLYLQGQNLLKDCSLPGLRRARQIFRRAVRADPEFALPNGRIAQTFYLEWLIRGGGEPELLHKSRQFARRAMILDQGASIGFWISAIVDLYQRRFDEAAEQFAEAEALSPNCADLLVEHADALGHLGQADRGWKKFERAIELNPLPPDHYWWAGASIAFCRERYDTAIELCNKMKNTEPAVRLLAASHALLGQEAEARSYGRRIKEMYPSQPAGEIIKMAPTRVEKVGEQFLKGLRIAGV